MSSESDFKKVMKGLKKLPVNIQKNVMNGAVRAGTVVIKDQAQREAPEGTGNLKKSITVRKNKVKRKSVITSFRVAVQYTPQKGKETTKGRDAYYASLIHYGSIRHSPNPFMSRAAAAKAGESVTAARKYITKRLPKEVAKIKGGR